MSKLGKPFSVRLEEGHAEEIRMLSGRPPGEVLRQLAAAWLVRARADRTGAPESKLDREIAITAGRVQNEQHTAG
jgi:hypothetical protein